MRLHDPFTLLTLAGLVMDVTGAFVLAAEAIGLARVRAMAEKLRLGTRHLKEGDGPRSDPRPPLYLLVVSLPVAAVMTWLLNRVAPLSGTGLMPMSHESRVAGMFVFLYMPSVMLVAIFITAVLRYTIRFLENVSVSTEKRTAGVWGFTLIFIGFLLQFLGSLGSFTAGNLWRA